jgi:cold shock CspA family protein
LPPVERGRTLCEPPTDSINHWGRLPVPSGVVKWFDPERGVGVITQDGERPDAVAYRSAIQGNWERTLIEGESVVFNVTQDSAGIRADNVRPLGPQGRAVRRSGARTWLWPGAGLGAVRAPTGRAGRRRLWVWPEPGTEVLADRSGPRNGRVAGTTQTSGRVTEPTGTCEATI